MRTYVISLLLCMCMAGGAAHAQHRADIQQRKLEQSRHLGFFGQGETDSASVDALVSRFYMDQFRHSQDPRAPYFMLLSRDASMAMGIGGTIQTMAFYDWGSPIDGSDFATYSIPTSPDPSSPNLFQTSIGQSALFFTMFGHSAKLGDYKFYIEAKFKGGGSSHVFALSKAYATVGGWTLGYATSGFADPAAQPATVETAGPNSEVTGTRVLVRYIHQFKQRWTVSASMEAPHFNPAPATEHYKGGSCYMPNFTAFGQYGTATQHVRLSALVKGMRYRDLVNRKNGYVAGWGLNLTAVFRPVMNLTVYAAGNYGHGIGSMVNDLSCGDNDLMGLLSEPGKMYAPRSYGWYAAAQYNYRPNLYSTLVFSQERLLLRQGTDCGEGQYRRGLYGAANVFWEITPRCTVAAELDLGERADQGGAHRWDRRCILMAKLSF